VLRRNVRDIVLRPCAPGGRFTDHINAGERAEIRFLFIIYAVGRRMCHRLEYRRRNQKRVPSRAPVVGWGEWTAKRGSHARVSIAGFPIATVRPLVANVA